MKAISCLGTVLLILATPAPAQQPGDAVFPAPGEPQVIHFDEHTKLTLLGTSYGRHHVAPHFENLSTGNWIYTAPNTTVVWIEEEHDPGNSPSYELLVSDRANTGCVNIERRQGSFVKAGVSLQSFVLNAYPRWDKETILRVRPYQGTSSTEQFVLTNPLQGTFPQWTPEPLPSTKSDGNLEVTLTRLIAGAPTPHREGSSPAPANDPAGKCVHLNFDFRENGQSTTNWKAWPVQVTDAAGNSSRGLIYAYASNAVLPNYPDRVHPSFPPAYDGYYFQPGLWPNQPWKVRLEFIRQANFSDDELVAFTNVPVRAGTQQDWDDEWNAWDIGRTNFPFTVTPGTANGVHLKLLPPLLVPNRWSPDQKGVSVIIGADPDFNPRGMNISIVAATDEQGHELGHPFGVPWAGHYSLEFPNIREIKMLSLKLALHKSRFVEFTVKPETK